MANWTDFLNPNEPDGAYLPWKKVEPRVGISRTTAWRLQQSGDFPKPYVVSPGRVAYRESEVEAWKASRGHRSAATTRPAPDPSLITAESEGALQTPGEPPDWSPTPPPRTQPAQQEAGHRSRESTRSLRRGGRSASDDQMEFEF
jgi:predicted DNA-binding transcriptional regulator AlpA